MAAIMQRMISPEAFGGIDLLCYFPTIASADLALQS